MRGQSLTLPTPGARNGGEGKREREVEGGERERSRVSGGDEPAGLSIMVASYLENCWACNTRLVRQKIELKTLNLI